MAFTPIQADVPDPQAEATARLRHLKDSRERKLSLSGLNLGALPDKTCQLTWLEELYCDGCGLTSLPDSLSRLTNLRTLSLIGNKITVLPDDIGCLSHLSSLLLAQNSLTALPTSLRSLSELTTLSLHQNPALELPSELLGPSPLPPPELRPNHVRDLLTYYFSRREDSEGVRPLNEVKLLLVGRGGAGKTSLIRTAIVQRPFDPHEKETPGIAIAPWLLRCGGEQVTVHVWDFAGQEITHETHRFFLTERSLYLLVLDGRAGTQEDDADYWLSHIQKYGAESPTIVSLNKWESPAGFSLERRRLKRSYPFIRAFIETDCKTGLGLATLVDTIREIVLSVEMDKVRTLFPAKWFRVKECVAQLRIARRYFLTYKELAEVCGTCGIALPELHESLARTLHRLGIALYYGDNQRLRDTRVLVPDWVANGVYGLLRGVQKHKGEQTGPGLLPRGEVAQALKVGLEGMEGASIADYPVAPGIDTHQFLLDLMVDRELCFVAQGSNEAGAVYLLPELLASDEPENVRLENFLAEALKRFIYRYDLLPDGLMARFIVRSHLLSDSQPRWKRGVILAWEGSQALVLAEKRERTVEIYIRGGSEETRLQLAGIIRSTLHAIHAELPEALNVREEIDPAETRDQWLDVRTLRALERRRLRYPVVVNAGKLFESTANLDPTAELSVLEPASARAPTAPRLKLFISYAHLDRKYFDAFSINLAILQNEGLVEVWWDGELRPGEEWDRVIRENIRQADMVIFLMSNPFFASRYITGVEVELARVRHKKREAVIVPVLLDVCNFQAHEWLSALQALPSVKGQLVPIVGFHPNQRHGWHAVAQGLRRVITSLKSQRG